jgi:ketosteroid isomerase-like protein
MLVACASSPQQAAEITPADVEKAVRAEFRAYETRDIETLAEKFNPERGYGFRTRDIRPAISRAEFAETLKRFYAAYESYGVRLERVDAAVYGDVAVAWGVYVEEFKLRGREPQVVRVRFSETMKREEGGWRMIMGHRDAQPFDVQGRYIPQATNR